MNISFLEFLKVVPVVPESEFEFVFLEYRQFFSLQTHKFYRYNHHFENVLSDIVSPDVLNKIKANQRRTQLIRMAKLFALTEFEHDLYLNPKQDF